MSDTRIRMTWDDGETCEGTLAEFIDANSEDEDVCAVLSELDGKPVGTEAVSTGFVGIFVTFRVLA